MSRYSDGFSDFSQRVFEKYNVEPNLPYRGKNPKDKVGLAFFKVKAAGKLKKRSK